MSHLAVSAFAPMLQLGCSSATLLIVSFHILCPHPPPPPFNSLPLSLPPSFPLCEGCCFTLLCGCECWSPREAEERMYPRGLFGVLLSVDQHAPDWLTSSSSMHWEALTGAPGPLVYLKHEFNHPQNTWPFRLCTDMFRMILYSKVKAKGGGDVFSILVLACNCKMVCKLCD